MFGLISINVWPSQSPEVSCLIILCRRDLLEFFLSISGCSCWWVYFVSAGCDCSIQLVCVDGRISSTFFFQPTGRSKKDLPWLSAAKIENTKIKIRVHNLESVGCVCTLCWCLLCLVKSSFYPCPHPCCYLRWGLIELWKLPQALVKNARTFCLAHRRCTTAFRNEIYADWRTGGQLIGLPPPSTDLFSFIKVIILLQWML